MEESPLYIFLDVTHTRSPLTRVGLCARAIQRGAGTVRSNIVRWRHSHTRVSVVVVVRCVAVKNHHDCEEKTHTQHTINVRRIGMLSFSQTQHNLYPTRSFFVETHKKRHFTHTDLSAAGPPAELKHITQRRKRKQP